MNITCPHCKTQNNPSAPRKQIVSIGSFFRKEDQTHQKRFRCRACSKTFSKATGHPCFRQHKRLANPSIFKMLSSGISLRRLALLLELNRKTVVRKFIFLGLESKKYFQLHRDQFDQSSQVEFDDLETFEHSKLKPLSVTMAVESKTRRILGYRVAQMPAKGHLVEKSLKKYGVRQDDRPMVRNELFSELKNHVHSNAVFKSDKNPHYPSSLKNHFPDCEHFTTKGLRGCVVGQGELKGGGYDPLFTLNHTFAMTRANINRLFRRTWNTTKKLKFLDLHFAIYTVFHNIFLLKLETKIKPSISSIPFLTSASN